MAKKIYISILVASILALGVFSVVSAQPPTPINDADSESPAPFGERVERDMPTFHSPAMPNGPGPHDGCGGDHELLAEALGLTVDELETALSEGQTVAELAEAQNVALDEVVEAVLAPMAERLEQAVTDGRLTQEEADARLADAEERLLEFFETGVCPEPEEGPRPPRPPRGGCGGDHELLAEALGLTVDELETALSEGQTVAELAEAQNVALDEVVEAVLAPMAERLEQAVTDGRLTQEEADARLADAEERLLEFFETGVCPEPEEGPRPPRPPRGGRGERPDLGEYSE